MEAVGAAPRASVPIRLRLLRRFSVALARAFALASRLICKLADGGWLGRGATLKSVLGDLGRLNTSRCEICGQAEHLNVCRSKATSDVGLPRCSICIRRILAPQAKHFIGFLPLDIERQGPHSIDAALEVRPVSLPALSTSKSYCVVRDAAFRMGDQRATSVFTRRAKLVGVLSCFAGIDPPRSASRFLTDESSSALSRAPANLLMSSLGVPFGDRSDAFDPLAALSPQAATSPPPRRAA
jgi:hypothetical protein